MTTLDRLIDFANNSNGNGIVSCELRHNYVVAEFYKEPNVYDAQLLASLHPDTVKRLCELVREAKGFAEIVLCNFPGVDKGLGSFEWLKKLEQLENGSGE